MMHLGDRNGNGVAVPGLSEAQPRPELLRQLGDAYGFDIDIGVAAVRSGRQVGIALHAVIEVALTCQIMVEADRVRLACAYRKLRQRLLRGDLVAQPAMEGM